MWDLYKLAFVETQNGDVLRRQLELLYPGEEIALIDAATYLTLGYYVNQLGQFRKFVESTKSKNG